MAFKLDTQKRLFFVFLIFIRVEGENEKNCRFSKEYLNKLKVVWHKENVRLEDKNVHMDGGTNKNMYTWRRDVIGWGMEIKGIESEIIPLDNSSKTPWHSFPRFLSYDVMNWSSMLVRQQSPQAHGKIFSFHFFMHLVYALLAPFVKGCPSRYDNLICMPFFSTKKWNCLS